jgi:hypothetical protein
LETLTANLAGRPRQEEWNGRQYLVVPLTMLVPGVLPGSKGPLLYPPDEVRKSPEDWNHIPIVVYHPMKDGKPVSARSPSILSKHGIGVVFHARTDGKDILKSEGWLDVEATRRVDKSVLDSVQLGKPLELSTGLFVDDEPAPEGAIFNDHRGSRKYVGIARNYKPDHLAILPSGKGACSLADGCGVLINRAIRSSRLARSRSMPRETRERIDKLKAWQKIGEALGLVDDVVGADLMVNEPSFIEINRKLSELLFNRFGKGGNVLNAIGSSDSPYVVDVYDEYVVYEQGTKTYRIGYKVDSNTNGVQLNGDPQEVTRVVSYEPVTHENPNPVAESPSSSPDPSVTPPPSPAPDPAANAKKMPSAGADVTPAKACAIVRDGGVHDASGKWRPLTQAQRGMFGALCGQAKGKKPTTHEDADDDTVLIRNAVAEIAIDEDSVENAKASGKGKGGASRWVTIEGEHILIKDKAGVGGGGEKGLAASAGTAIYKPVVADLHRASETEIAKHFAMIKAQAHTHPHEARKNAEDFLDKVESQKGKSYLHGLVLDHGISLQVNLGGKGTDNAPPLVLRKRLLDKLFPNSPTTHAEVEVEKPVEVIDRTPLDESLTVEDIVAMYDASPPAPNEINEEHVLALASVAERINGAARHPETGQFTSPDTAKESKSSKSAHLGEHSSTAYEATKKVKPGKGPASDSISYSTAAYGYAVAGDHVSAAKAHRKAATAHNKAYSNLREDNTERALHKTAENLHRAAARAHALLAGGPAANSEFTDTWADESDPLYGLTPEDVRDSLAELCGRQVTESVRESAILF